VSLHQPVLPAFDGPCVCNVVRALVPAGGEQPGWVPEPARGADQIVLLVLDGLGFEQFDANREALTTLARGSGRAITTVAPSTTAVALTSLTTGLAPARHGLVSYRMTTGGAVLQALRWQLDGTDARELVPPSSIQANPSFPSVREVTGGRRPPVVTLAAFAGTGFTAAHLADTDLRGWTQSDDLIATVVGAIAQGAPFVYAYYDGIDKTAHRCGRGEPYRAELGAADQLVARLVAALPERVSVVVTADHGQVEVGENTTTITPDLLPGVAGQSGEGRFRWLHVAEGATDAVAEAATELFGAQAWVVSRERVIEENWLGGRPSPEVADRLGQVAIVAFEPVAFVDPADAAERTLVARHGSLTSAEMLVPLIGFRGAR
jgi:hypothetical protein